MKKNTLRPNRFSLSILLTLTCLSLLAQPNCLLYKNDGDSSCYKACVTATKDMRQGSKYSQEEFDKAIDLCPTFAYAPYEKSVPFLKNGDYITWKKLIDRAVELDPSGYIGYRGWCRFQFLRDYEGAIKDIEQLRKLTPHDIGYSNNGSYHLNVVLALCYKGLGDKQRAINEITNHLNGEDYMSLSYELLHLGVLYLETGELEKAIELLSQQIETNDYFAENYYYLGLAYKNLGDLTLAVDHFSKARDFYMAERKMNDIYNTGVDQIFLSDIESAIESTN